MEGNTNYEIDTSVVIDMMNGISQSVTSFVTGALPILGGIGCAVLVFFLGRMVFRLIKSWMSAGK